MSSFVIYHDNCTDGSAAAYIAWVCLDGDTQFFAASRDKDPPLLNQLYNCDVYFLDFVYPRWIMEEIKKVARKIIILDHHLTAAQDMEGFEFEGKFDMQKSGAMLAYEYFAPVVVNKEVIERIQDRDLWTNKFEDTKEIAALFFSIDPLNVNDRENLDTWSDYLRWDVEALKKIGYGAYLARQNTIKQTLKTAYETEIDGHKVYIANATECWGDVAMELAEKYEFGVTYKEKGGKYYYSLRSKKFDVSELAKKFGGGGHKFAAAFITNEKIHK